MIYLTIDCKFIFMPKFVLINNKIISFYILLQKKLILTLD